MKMELEKMAFLREKGARYEHIHNRMACYMYDKTLLHAFEI